MKKKLNIVITITIPIEIEAKDMIEAVSKAWKMIPEIDTDSGEVEYALDFSPYEKD